MQCVRLALGCLWLSTLRKKKPVNMCEWLNLTLNVVTLSHENILIRLYCLNVLTKVSGSGLLLTLIVHCNLLQAIRSL